MCTRGFTPQRVRSMTIDPQAAVGAGQPPLITGLGLVDDGVADHAARDRPDMKLDGAAVIRRDGGRQISPPPRALGYRDVDVLAGGIGHRAVQLPPDPR